MRDYKKSPPSSKTMIKTASIIFLSMIFIFTVQPVFPAVLRSSSILVDIDDTTGRLFLSTVNGKDDVEGDENSNLLFYDEPPTSYTIVYVDDELFVFGSTEGVFSLLPVNRNSSIEAVWENDLVRVRQIVTFVQRKGTGKEEGALIQYRVENKSKKKRSIGFRILYDTYLGEKGQYHFELSGRRRISFETTLENKSLPTFWRSQSEKNPALCLSGLLKGGIVTVPYKINFANFKTLQDHLEFGWVVPDTKRKRRFDNLPFSKDDSAVALYFKPVPVDPGGVREVNSMLGLCGIEDFTLETSETVVKIVKNEGEKKPPEFQQKHEDLSLLSQADLDRIVKELKRIKLLHGSLDDINGVIKRINEILASEGKKVEEDELVDILDSLQNMRKKP